MKIKPRVQRGKFISSDNKSDFTSRIVVQISPPPPWVEWAAYFVIISSCFKNIKQILGRNQ